MQGYGRAQRAAPLLPRSNLRIPPFPMTFRSFLGLLGCIALCQLAGGLGAISTASEIETWYATLAKPPFNPPSWAFGVVWPILYTLMGVALWLVWKKGTEQPGVKAALGVFFAQLVVNAIWSPVFFGLHQIGWALVIIVAMLGLIAATMRRFAPLSKVAAYLLAPYLAWVAFATVLNASIWWLNRGG